MIVYFVRHGESEANAAGITAGRRLDAGLTEHGKHQASKLGAALKKKNIDFMVSSPMKRALQTATIIAQSIGYDPTKIITSELFSERDVGEMTGAKRELVRTYFDAGITPPGAEKTEDFYARTVQGLEWLQKQPAKNVVLVSHGGPGRMIRIIYRQEKHSELNSLGRIGNAEIIELSL